MSKLKKMIEFLDQKMQEIDNMNFSAKSVQQIVDFGLDTKNKLNKLNLSPGENFLISVDLFQNLLDEEFKADDDKFFRESKDDLIMDISLLISRLEKLQKRA